MSDAVFLTLGRHEECSSLSRVVAETVAPELSGRARNLKKHAEIVLSAGPFDRLYRLESGLLTLVASDAEGRQVPMRSIVPGDFFGEFCFCAASTGPHDSIVAR